MEFDLDNEYDVIKKQRIGTIVVVFHKKTRKTFSVTVYRGSNIKSMGTWGCKKYAATKYNTIVATTKIIYDMVDKKPEVILRRKTEIPAIAG